MRKAHTQTSSEVFNNPSDTGYMKDNSVYFKYVVKVVLSALLLQESKIKSETREYTPGRDL